MYKCLFLYNVLKKYVRLVKGVNMLDETDALDDENIFIGNTWDEINCIEQSSYHKKK